MGQGPAVLTVGEGEGHEFYLLFPHFLSLFWPSPLYYLFLSFLPIFLFIVFWKTTQNGPIGLTYDKNFFPFQKEHA